MRNPVAVLQLNRSVTELSRLLGPGGSLIIGSLFGPFPFLTLILLVSFQHFRQKNGKRLSRSLKVVIFFVHGVFVVLPVAQTDTVKR